MGFLAAMVLQYCYGTTTEWQTASAIAHWAGLRLSSYLYGAPQHFDLDVPLSGSVLQQQFRTVPMQDVPSSSEICFSGRSKSKKITY